MPQLASWVFLGLTWLALLVYGLRERFLYDTTPGPMGQTPRTFPSESQLPRDLQRNTLFMFVHAECPCTRASMNELAALGAAQNLDFARVLVVAPTLATGERWEDTPAASLARRIPSLAVFADESEHEARRFGAMTSGHVALYDANGRLQFAGGITGSRGHVGENVGLQTVRKVLQRRAGSPQHHPVYGCSLGGDEKTEAQTP